MILEYHKLLFLVTDENKTRKSVFLLIFRCLFLKSQSV